MRLLITCSLLLSGCVSVQRPNSNIYGVNAVAKEMQGYNILHDYNNSGVLTTTTGFSQIVPVTQLSDINGWICTDNKSGITNIKTAISQYRDYVTNHCTCQ